MVIVPAGGGGEGHGFSGQFLWFGQFQFEEQRMLLRPKKPVPREVAEKQVIAGDDGAMLPHHLALRNCGQINRQSRPDASLAKMPVRLGIDGLRQGPLNFSGRVDLATGTAISMGLAGPLLRAADCTPWRRRFEAEGATDAAYD